MKKRCTNCGGPNNRRSQRWCHTCHAAYQRVWRKRERARINRLERFFERHQNVARETLTAARGRAA